MRRLRLVLASCAILLSGCWPYRYTTHPGIVGTVVSADDGAPVASAEVILIAPLWSQAGRRLTAKSGADGQFEIAPAYILENVPLPCSETGPVMTDLSTISLRRLP
jgi:hypothetical protein